jgi:hypothetical protein
MPRTTFLEKCAALGLLPVDMGTGLKSSKRWLESEIDTYIEKLKASRAEQLKQKQQQERQMLRLVRRKKTA